MTDDETVDANREFVSDDGSPLLIRDDPGLTNVRSGACLGEIYCATALSQTWAEILRSEDVAVTSPFV